MISDPSTPLEKPDDLPSALETVTWRTFPLINAFVYNELRSTGCSIISIDCRQDAIDLLPGVVQQHVFNQKVIQLTQDQAEDIIDQIDSLHQGFAK